MSVYLNKTLSEYNKCETIVITDLNACNELLKNSNLKIFNMNIRSLAHNFDELLILMSSIQQNKFDIIILTETFQISSLDNFNIPDYNIYYNQGKINRNDGVVVYTKTNLGAKADIVNHLDTNILRIKFEEENIKYGLSATYRSHEIPIYSFLLKLKDYLSTCKENNEIFLGDINIDILGTTQESLDYLNIMSEYGFISHINEYTREINDSRSCLDHIFFKSTQTFKSVNGIILQTTITDHYSTILTINYTMTKLGKNQTMKTKIQKLDKNKFKQIISSQSWEVIMNQINPNTACDIFIKIMQHCQNTSTTILTINSKNRKRKSWITGGLINSINKRNKLKQKLRKDPTNLELLQYYKTYRNLLNTCIKDTKASFYKCTILKAPNDAKHLWNTIKDSVNSSNKNNNDIDSILCANGKKSKNPNDIANEFNTFFNNVGKNLANDIIRENIAIETDHDTTTNQSTSTIFLYPTTTNEIQNAIYSLKNSKSSGTDSITVESLKLSRENIAIPLQHICNLIFKTGIFPDKLKVSLIIPIHKAGSKDSVSNYRPIALLSNVSKVIEKCIKNRVLTFLEKNNLLFSQQYGFRKKRSTEDAIRTLITEIYSTVDSGAAAAAVFLDLAKAFDTISHEILLQKLEKMGIRGNANALFRSYLSNRKQQVKIKDTVSDILHNKWGVPQGSVLGPILFLVYINDLSQLNNDCLIISFADDTVIYFSANTWAEIYQKISKKLKDVTNWLNSNLLTLNIEKTKCIPFTSYRNHLPPFENVIIHGTTKSIKTAYNIKYLGLLIDSHLKWDLHILELCGKMRKTFFLLKTIRQFLDLQQMKTVYYALIQSLLTYGISGWGGIKKSKLKPLEVVQKTILKIIYRKSPLYPSMVLFQETQILNIRNLYIKKLILRIYTQNKQYATHNYSTRSISNEILMTSTARKTIGTRSPIFLGTRLYNMIPTTIKNITSLFIFKRQLTLFLLTNQVNPLTNLLESI